MKRRDLIVLAIVVVIVPVCLPAVFVGARFIAPDDGSDKSDPYGQVSSVVGARFIAPVPTQTHALAPSSKLEEVRRATEKVEEARHGGALAKRHTLLRALQSPDKDVRAEAAIMLIQAQDVQAVPGIIEAINAERNNGMYWRIPAVALAQPWAVPGLIEALKHPSIEVQVRAADFLGDTGDSRAVGPLFEMLSDGLEQEQTATGVDNIRDAFEKAGYARAALVRLKNPSEMSPALALLAQPIGQYQDEALKIIEVLPPDETAIAPLAQLLSKDISNEVREKVIHQLARRLQFSSAQKILGSCLGDKNEKNVSDASRELNNLAFPAAESAGEESQDDKKRRGAALEMALRWPKTLAEDKQRAVQALGELRDPHAVPQLVNLLTDVALGSDAEEALVRIAKAGEEAIAAEINRITYRPMGWKSSVGKIAQRIYVRLGKQSAVREAMESTTYWEPKMVRAMLIHYLKFGQKKEILEWFRNVCLYSYGLAGKRNSMRVAIFGADQELGVAAFNALKMIGDMEWLHANVARLVQSGLVLAIDPAAASQEGDSGQVVVIPADGAAIPRPQTVAAAPLSAADFDAAPRSVEGLIELLRGAESFEQEKSSRHSSIKALMAMSERPQERDSLKRLLAAKAPGSVPALVSALRSQNFKVGRLAYETLHGLGAQHASEEGRQAMREFESFVGHLSKWRTLLQSDDYMQLVESFNGIGSRDQLIEIAKLLTTQRNIARMGQIMTRAKGGEYFYPWLAEMPYKGYAQELLDCPDEKLQERSEEIEQVKAAMEGIKLAHGMLENRNETGALDLLQEEAAHPPSLPVLLTVLFHYKIPADFKVLIAQALKNAYGRGAHGDITQSLFDVDERVLFPIAFLGGPAHAVDLNEIFMTDDEVEDGA